MKLTFSKKDMEETEKVLLVNHLPKVNPEPHSPRYTYPNKFMPSLHPPRTHIQAVQGGTGLHPHKKPDTVRDKKK